MKQLTGKIAWITGGSSGIGLAGAQALADLGAHVLISARSTDVLQEAVERIRQQGGSAEPIQLDVGDGRQVSEAATQIESRHGKVDILVNSAGLNVARRKWAEVDSAGWENVFNVNVHGSFNCIAAVLPGMRERKDGLIINIASWAGRFDSKAAGPAYTSAKHAVCAMTRSLNIEEHGNGIRACVICPGEVDTPIMQHRAVPPTQVQLDLMLKAEDLGATISYVALMPARACVSEIVVGPTQNAAYR
jgi:NADP-dependent 3-hydroxy acid dehydrogenase YdfG